MYLFRIFETEGGFRGKLPDVARPYDFINHIVKLDERPRLKRQKRKPKGKLGKEKLPPKCPGIVRKLVD